jgi:hypothetical protein
VLGLVVGFKGLLLTLGGCLSVRCCLDHRSPSPIFPREVLVFWGGFGRGEAPSEITGAKRLIAAVGRAPCSVFHKITVFTGPATAVISTQTLHTRQTYRDNY